MAKEPASGTKVAISQNPATDRPNIVIIYADDLGYGDVSSYNPASRIQTPAIDALAESGIRFTDGHSGSAVCTPSRYSLMTGEYSWRGPLKRGVIMPWESPLLSQDQESLADLLRNAGYDTAHIGKWHLGFEWPWKGAKPAHQDVVKDGWRSVATNVQFDWTQPLRGGPTDHGFTSYFGDDVPNFPPYAWIENDRIMHPDAMADVPRSILITTGYSGVIHGGGPGEANWQLDAVPPALEHRAIDYIRSQKDSGSPFFLNLWLTSPHTPVVPLPEFDGASEAGSYGDYVAQTDSMVGAVVDALRETGQLDNTLIIFSSDNGPEVFSYRLLARFDHDGVAGRRGLKGDTWEGGHLVPFIISWPSSLEGGRTADALVSQIDIYATIADLLELDLPEGAAHDSESFLGVLRGNTATARKSLVYQGTTGVLGMRDGNWVYLQGGGFGRIPGAMWEEPEWYRKARGVIETETKDALYDLSRDPDQLRNVILDHPEIADRLRTELETIKAN